MRVYYTKLHFVGCYVSVGYILAVQSSSNIICHKYLQSPITRQST